MRKILIVDDEDSVLRILSTLFKSKGFDTVTASDGGDAMEILAEDQFDILLTDVRMRPMDGLALLKFAKDHVPDMPVIMLTAYASVESAIEALKHGAFDYVTKPFDVTELVATVERALDYKKGITPQVKSLQRKDVRFYLDGIIAESSALQAVCNKVKKIAPTDTFVTIIGESGCTKGMLAEALHNNSKRKGNPFIRINCAVMPEPLLEAELLGYEKGYGSEPDDEKKGVFEQAQGGTILLEEICCLPPRLQEVLLDIIINKRVCRLGGDKPHPVNARIISSSHSELDGIVKRGEFSEDLYHRMNLVVLRVTPLRERHEDIVPLFAMLLGRSPGKGPAVPEIPEDTQALLRSYQWPGNAEELENAASFAAANLKKGSVTRESLPAKIADTPVLPEAMEHEPMKARSLKAFLMAEGAEEDLAAAEAESGKAQENRKS